MKLTTVPQEIASRMGLGSYYFRKGSFEEAKAIFLELASVSSRNALREFSKKQIYSIEKYQLDQKVRRRKEAK